MTSMPATLLRWGGGLLAGAIIAASASSVADAMAQHGIAEPELSFAVPDELNLWATGSVVVHVDPDLREVSVQAFARSGFNVPKLTVVGNDSSRSVGYDCPATFAGSCTSDLVVTLPYRTSLLISTDNGDISVDGGTQVRVESSGGQNLMASSTAGRVTVTNWDGQIAAVSSSGAVEVDQVSGMVTLQGTSSSLAASNVDGTCEASTASGPISLTSVTGDITASSDSGDIRVTSPADAGPVALDIHTASGVQTVRGATDPAAAVQVTLRSTSGDLTYQ